MAYDFDLLVLGSGPGQKAAIAGAKLGRRGRIKVDDDYRTSAPHVYAACTCSAPAPPSWSTSDRR